MDDFSELSAHIGTLQEYLDSVAEYSSFWEYLERDISSYDMTMAAESALSEITCHPLAWEAPEEALSGYFRAVRDYPWVKDGLDWARQEYPRTFWTPDSTFSNDAHRMRVFDDFRGDISHYDTWEEYLEADSSAREKAELAIEAIRHMVEHGGYLTNL